MVVIREEVVIGKVRCSFELTRTVKPSRLEPLRPDKEAVEVFRDIARSLFDGEETLEKRREALRTAAPILSKRCSAKAPPCDICLPLQIDRSHRKPSRELVCR